MRRSPPPMTARTLPAADLDGGLHPLGLPRWGPAAPGADAWAAAVGPAVVSLGIGGESPPPPARNLRIVTWNVRVGAGRLEEFLQELRREDRPFVLLLQEALRVEGGVPVVPPGGSLHAERIADPLAPGVRRGEIARLARESGTALVYVPSMRNGGRGDPAEDRGNAILSSLPLEDPFALELPVERQRRTAVGASVQVAGPDGEPRSLRLLSVHLENRAPWRRFWRIPGAARAAQARTLVEFLRGEGGEIPTVLGGDLNTWWGEQREPALRILREHFPQPATLERRPTHHWELGLDRQSDYLLFQLPPGWTGRAWRLDDERGSDHWPVEGALETPSNGGAPTG